MALSFASVIFIYYLCKVKLKQNKMKQTAVEWFFEKVMITHPDNLDELLEQAKEMEKEQIMDAWISGALDTNAYTDFAKQYYNETFKSEKHNTDIRSMDKLIESNKKFDENNLKGFKYDPNDRSEDTPDITNFFY